MPSPSELGNGASYEIAPHAKVQADAGTRGPGFDNMTGNGATEPGPEGEWPAEEGTVEGEFREV
jgi:hypothetical protein